MFLYSHHFCLSICLSACISACYAWLPRGITAYSTPRFLCYAPSLASALWLPGLPSSSCVCPRWIQRVCRSEAASRSCSATTPSPWQWGFFFQHLYILQVRHSPHIWALFSLFHLICWSLRSVKMLCSYRTFTSLPTPTAVQLLSITECKHNLDTTDAFLPLQRFTTTEVRGRGL